MSYLHQRPVYGGTLTDAALADRNNTHSILLRLVGTGQEVLEIGCAAGRMTRMLTERQGCRVTGFEVNVPAAEAARPYLQQLIVGDLENPADLARLGGQFDVVLMADVLEHLAQPEVPLHCLRERLRPTGRLIISLPNVAHWSVRRALLAGRWDLSDEGLMDRTHLQWFTRRTASTLIESTGYRIREHRVSYAFPAHRRLGLGRLAAWAQARTLPKVFDDLFGIQHIFVATCS